MATGVLVGRDRELGELSAALDRAPSDGGALFLLSGEPGIGKTRLATEASRAARDRGVVCAWGRCWEAGGAPLFWPWREAFDALGVSFPEPAAIAGGQPAEARFALLRELARTIARAAADRRLLIVIEDLHAADRSTLVVLEYVASQLRDLPVTVIGTYRDLEARLRADCAESIARLTRAGRVLHLSRLDAGAVALMVRDGIDGADERLVATVYDATHGNPLFVDEVVRDIRAHGRRSGLPLGVSEVIRQRLAPLSAESRTALDAAAVLGVELSEHDLGRMVHDAPAALEDPLRRGVLVRRGERLRFSHALYREALYHELSHARRQALHRDAARAVGATGASAAEVAHHLLESGPEAAAEAVERAIVAAGHAVDRFAFEDAISVLERARAVIPEGPLEGTLRCRVTTALGETTLRGGDPTGRAICLDAAKAARALGDAELLARAALAYGSVLLMGGVDPVLVSMLEDALARLPDEDTPIRARVMARLAAARQPSPPAERARDMELGLSAIAMARRVADPRELLGVLHAASGVLYNHADPAVRIAVSRDQERLAEELGDTPRLLHARVRLAIDHLEQADFASYARLATSYEALATRVGPAAGLWRVPLMRSMIALARDDFAESERQQAEARRMAADEPRALRAHAFHRIGFLRAAERHAELRAAIPELRGLWLAMPYGSMLADARVSSVLARIGADDDVREVLERLPAEALDEEINASTLADALWATGDLQLANRLEPLLTAMGDRWHAYWFDCEVADGPNARARAIVAAVQGRWDECERLFSHAMAEVEGIGRRSLAARMRFELGDLLLRLGRETSRARDLIAAAREGARTVGLPELVALIDRRHPAALPSAAASVGSPARVALRPRAFSMTREGEYYAVSGTHGTVRFKASRGFEYLAALVARPHEDVHVLDLVGSSAHADRGDAGELVDDTALSAYRARLEALREAVETAEGLGHAERAERARSEMESIAAELARTTRKGGRSRRGGSAVDRARSAVQRRIKDALDRVAEQDADLGAWLRKVIRTGNCCGFHPND